MRPESKPSRDALQPPPRRGVRAMLRAIGPLVLVVGGVASALYVHTHGSARLGIQPKSTQLAALPSLQDTRPLIEIEPEAAKPPAVVELLAPVPDVKQTEAQSAPPAGPVAATPPAATQPRPEPATSLPTLPPPPAVRDPSSDRPVAAAPIVPGEQAPAAPTEAKPPTPSPALSQVTPSPAPEAKVEVALSDVPMARADPAETRPAPAPTAPSRATPEPSIPAPQEAPTPAPPAASPSPEPRTKPAAVTLKLFERGKTLLGDGNIAGARLFLERAAEAGHADAALLLGDTFDPLWLASNGAHGTRPEPATARRWYATAQRLGSREAQARLARSEPGN